MADTVLIAGEPAETSGYRFSWGLAIAGGIIATAVTFFLLTLGAGFGLLLVNPVTHSGPSMTSFLTGGAIYFLAAMAFGFAAGGHLAGRLLAPQLESARQEEFRAAAHGLVAWATAVIATVVIVTIAGLVAAGFGATTAALYGASSNRANPAGPTALLVDRLFRPADLFSPAERNDAGARYEAANILDAGLARGADINGDDRARLDALVSQQAGISRAAASRRIDALQYDARQAANTARKAASYASLWMALSLLFGAIVAMAAAVYARNEDDREMLAADQV